MYLPTEPFPSPSLLSWNQPQSSAYAWTSCKPRPVSSPDGVPVGGVVLFRSEEWLARY